jgi:hypothetical protein
MTCTVLPKILGEDTLDWTLTAHTTDQSGKPGKAAPAHSAAPRLASSMHDSLSVLGEARGLRVRAVSPGGGRHTRRRDLHGAPSSRARRDATPPTRLHEGVAHSPPAGSDQHQAFRTACRCWCVHRSFSDVGSSPARHQSLQESRDNCPAGRGELVSGLGQ